MPKQPLSYVCIALYVPFTHGEECRSSLLPDFDISLFDEITHFSSIAFFYTTTYLVGSQTPLGFLALLFCSKSLPKF